MAASAWGSASLSSLGLRGEGRGHGDPAWLAVVVTPGRLAVLPRSRPAGPPHGQLQFQGRRLPLQANFGAFPSSARWRLRAVWRPRVSAHDVLGQRALPLWGQPPLAAAPCVPAPLPDHSSLLSARALPAGLAQRQPPHLLQVLESDQPEFRGRHPSARRRVAVSRGVGVVQEGE